MKLTWLLLLPLLLMAEEKKLPKTEVEFEAASDGGFGLAFVKLEFEKPGLEVFTRAYRTLEEGHKFNQGLLGVGKPIHFLKSHFEGALDVTPGMALVVGQDGYRGLAPSLEFRGLAKKTSVECTLIRNFSLREGRGYLWISPLKVAQRLTNKWEIAGVLETSHSGGQNFNEYGPRLSRKDSRGAWFIGYMTSVKEEVEDHRVMATRHHAARFGRQLHFK